MNEQTVTGSCLCGAVSIEVDLPSLWCAHCHCSQCQRFHGAALVTWVGFSSEGFRVTAGADSLHWYRSSPPAQRGSCANCGSSFLFQSERWPGEMHVSLSNLHGPIDRAPEAHVNYATHAPWLELADHLPRKD
ncbi:MAG: GFA family protein [Halieaceae bacterium]